MRRFAPIVLLAFAVGGCTGGAVPTPSVSASRSFGAGGPGPFVMDVVAGTGGPAATLPPDAVLDGASYLEGMRLAQRALNAGGGVGGRPPAPRLFDDGGGPARAPATLAGPAPAGP